MPVTAGDAVALTRTLVAIDSRNPGLTAGAPGEGAVARVLAETLRAWGMSVTVTDVAPGRPNVIARCGTPGGPTLMFNGHLDVVGTDGMSHAPWSAEEREGRIWGRGSADMKAGVAAMCAAAWRAARTRLDGEIIVAAVADEEFTSLGTEALIASGMRADAAIVTEPTRLAIMPAHRGFAWIEVTVHGRAAHGSRYDIGVDAIRHAALVLAELDALDNDELPARPAHPLLGRASLHAGSIEGGSGMSTYPDRCVVSIERRTLPGETRAGIEAEVRAAIDRARARRPDLRADVAMGVSRPPSDVPSNAPVVRALDAALRDAGVAVRVEGMSAWTDAALLNDAGIPAICFGPGDIAHAHAAEEYVEVDEIRRATDVLARLALDWCRGKDTSAWRS